MDFSAITAAAAPLAEAAIAASHNFLFSEFGDVETRNTWTGGIFLTDDGALWFSFVDNSSFRFRGWLSADGLVIYETVEEILENA